MSWLSGREIEVKIQRNADFATRQAFYGICAMDHLPFAVPQYPFIMIVNTQSHNLPGEHWISVYMDKYHRAEVFDPLALPVPKRLLTWLNQFSRSITSNHLMFQHPLSSQCGAFAIHYVLHRLHTSKMTYSSSVMSNETFIHNFYNRLK